MKSIHKIVKPLVAAVLFAGSATAYGDNAAPLPPNLGLPPPAAAPAQSAKPKTLDEALKQFADADAKRNAAKLGTQERATAAQAASDLAFAIAWMEFDAEKYGDAVTWFAKRASLSQDAYKSQSAYVDASSRSTGALIAAKEATATGTMKTMWRDMGVTLKIASTSDLEMLARSNNDSKKLLQLEQSEIDLRNQVVANLQTEHASQDKIDDAHISLAKAMEGTGGALADLGRYEEAEKIYRDALAIRTSLAPNVPNRGLDEPLSDLALLYSDMGDYPKSRDYYLKALDALNSNPNYLNPPDQPGDDAQLKMLRKANAVIEEVKIINNLGSVLGYMGDYKDDLDYEQKALKLVDTIPSDGMGAFFQADMRALVLGNIAAVHSDSGQTDLALKEFLDVINRWTVLGDDNSLAVALSNTSGIYDEMGDNDKAQAYEAQALDIAASHQDAQSVVLAALHMASLSRKANDLSKADQNATQALILAKNTGSRDLTSSAERSVASIRLKQNKLAEAAALLDDAEKLDTEVGAPLNTEYTYDLQGQVLEAEGKPDEALAKYKQAITILESVRAASASTESDFGSLQNNYQPYEHIVKLLIKMGKTEDAFDYLSRAKSKQLQDTLSLSSIKTGDKALQALLDRAGALQSKLDAVRGQIQAEQQKPADVRSEAKIESLRIVAAQTQGEYYDLSDQIKDKYPDYDQMLTVKPTELASAQDSIPDDAVLIEYAPLGDQLYIFLVTKTSLKIYTPPVKPDDVWARIADTRKKIALPGDADFTIAERGAKRARVKSVTPEEMASVTDDLTTLYDMLIAPIEQEIANKKTLLFVPTHQLYYLPMQALAKKEANGNLRFLIQDKQIVYLAAADVLSVVEPHHGAIGEGLTAIGDPTGANLPFAEDEVNAISKIFGDSNVLTGSEATKSAIENPANFDRRVLHFATHGILDPAMPRKSYIQLAENTSPDQSELTVGDIYGLPLSKIDLVTISACETAVGEDHPGSEILSLATAFSRAKARSVVASLWSVSDDSTKEIMVEFYKQLAAGKSKAEALQAAQIKVMQMPQFKHPFYWAPFILMGDWR
jgi:CHAT domain-containing protein